MMKSSCAVTARAVASLVALLAGAGEALSAVIPVTTVQQKISSSGGCSLQEAIFSANLDNNVAIAGYDGSTPIEVITQCVPGNGDDIIVLPANGLLRLSKIVDDHINPAGPTATPIITSNITILGYGATLERTGNLNFRLFTVGSAGNLTLRRAYIRGFRAQGGNGGNGGGGGLGAGGAIFVWGGGLIVEASTFEGNTVLGGQGSRGLSGGGGGMGGNGGPKDPCGNGGGGGGARGHGGSPCHAGGGGGGTLRSASESLGGFACGANGFNDADGRSAPCPGGGGSGGSNPRFTNYDGGRGNYGGGGGGGGGASTDGLIFGGGDGGRGGFGGGGGASGFAAGLFGTDGGDGGFGGGGAAGSNGDISDGDSGNGGFFAGNGRSVFLMTTGGGGAGLGGAIFNDSGTVDIRNSTFSANKAVGGSSPGAPGRAGGGAIFSRNGSLTVLNTTISGNQALSGIGGGIIVAQDSEDAPTTFVLQNSIIANSSDDFECSITGFSIVGAFAGNLIMFNNGPVEFRGKTFIGCPGVVTSSDPQLGPLAYNQGATPTMAIGSTSPAFNAADPNSSLAVDQRRQDRPAMGGFDIGAFELCLEGFGRLQAPCLIVNRLEDPGGSSQGVELTVNVNPPGGGTTLPAAGTREVALESVVALKASPNAGFRFTEWSQNVTNPGDSSTTVFMNSAQTVTANFLACACASEVTSSIGIVYGGVTLNPVTRKYVQTVTLTNTSAAAIAAPISLVLDKLTTGVTLSNATGNTLLMLPAGSPYINANTNLAPGQQVAIQLQFTNPGNVVFSYEPRVLAGAGSR